MNGNREMEVHYIDTGFPYTATESFMDFFEGLTHVPLTYLTPNPNPVPLHDQESLFWYKFGYSGPESTSYYGPYNDALATRRGWEYPSIVTEEDLPTSDSHPQHTHAATQQEYISSDQNTNASEEVSWQDNIDPDNMTYEELLDLGEAVGTQSRGLSEELITMLPTSKYKFGSFFSRKKSGERCVICQMRYKRGDKQTTLPCKHVYHSECINQWLAINKICPVCNVEVFGDE